MVTSVGGTHEPSSSYDPMSHIASPSPSPSYGLGTPRWSMGGHWASSPASIAGLSSNRACVQVGPPLSCKRSEQRVGVGQGTISRVKAAGVIGGNVVPAIGDATIDSPILKNC